MRLIVMNKKILLSIVIVIIAAFGIGLYFIYTSGNDDVVTADDQNIASIAYKNTDYGFDLSLPIDWQGYSVVKDQWKGAMLTGTSSQSGPKLLIRNPKWTAAAPYEDLPILVFTIPQWDAYVAGGFSVSAAPIEATELGRNNVYVFALPPRWDFDYSLGYEEAQGIIAGKPLSTFAI